METALDRLWSTVASTEEASRETKAALPGSRRSDRGGEAELLARFFAMKG